MGLNWFKHRPVKPVNKDKPSSKPRQALNYKDLEIDENKKEEDDEEEDKEKEEKEEKEEQGSKKYEGEVVEENENEGDGSESSEPIVTASETAEITASETLTVENPLKDDPIIQDYFKMTRNPFETSPYAQLVEKLRIEAELAARPVVEEKKIRHERRIFVEEQTFVEANPVAI